MSAFPPPPLQSEFLLSNGQISPSWAGWLTQVALFITRSGGVPGPIPAASGGTGFASYAIGDILYANAATTLAKLPDVATGNALISGGVGVAPSWGKIGLTTHVSGVLGETNGGTGQSTYATGDLIYASGANTLTKRAIGSNTNVLTVAGGVPTWAAPATAGTVTSVAMSVPTFLSVAGSPVTSSGTFAVTLSGTALPVANGGTALTTLTSGNVMLGAGTSAPTFVAPSTSGNVLTSNGSTWTSAAPATSGTVTSVSVTTANGVSGSVATATTTPAITLTLGAITPTTVVASGAVTAAQLIPTGNSVPANGVYLPAANTVATATNGVRRWSVDGNGNVNMLNAAANPNYTVVLNTGGQCYFGLEGSGGSDVFTGGSAYASVFGTQNSTAVGIGTNGVTRVVVESGGQVAIVTVGKGLSIKEGSNAKMGTTTLVGGTITVSTTAVTANSRLFLTAPNGTLTNLGEVKETARTAGTSFTLTSLNILDTASYGWMLVEPA